MVVFIMPVKSSKVSSSWDHFSRLVERGIKSVCQQASQNFKLVVVCHEIPDISFQHPNLEFIQVDFDPPNLVKGNNELNNGLKEEDKSKKIQAGVAFARKYNPDYFMVSDADDLISNRIVSFVDKNSTQKSPGWYFKKGYIYREGDSFISLNKENFNTLCGTCIIVRKDLIDRIFVNRPHLEYWHKTIELTENTSLQPFPFPASVYSMANGENHYMSGAKIKTLNKGSLFSLNTLKGIIRKLKKYRVRPLTKGLKEEFGLYTV